MSRPAVSVVVPTRDRGAALAACLASVGAAAERVPGEVEVIVVDDSDTGSAEPVVAAFARAASDDLGVVRLDSRRTGGRGSGDARNLGARRARADVVAFTDDDTSCSAQWLSVALERLRDDASLAGVEGPVAPPGHMPTDRTRVRIVRSRDAGAFLTANMVVRREAYEKSGGFMRLRADAPRRWDHGFREDTDWGLRLSKRAGSVAFARDAVVEHPFEYSTLVRHLRTAMFFEVDAAFSALHPGYFRRQAGLTGRVRIRIATATILTAVTALAARRPLWAGAAALSGGALESARAEVELRSMGLGCSPARTGRSVAARTPRSVAWVVVAGAARLYGVISPRLGHPRLRSAG